MENHFLRLDNFSFTYPFAESAAFSDISFTLSEDETLGIVGPSGSGKTSLLYAIAGILQKHFPAGIFSGTILREGEKPTIDSTKIGFVFQDQYMQLSGVTETIEEEIAFALEQTGIPVAIIRQRVSEQISHFHLEHLAHRHPHSLSGGETRILALACELAKHPRWLLLDQPSESLHTDGVRSLINTLKKIKQTTRLIIVEHRFEIINAVCNKVLFLRKGEQKFFGAPFDLFTSKINSNDLDVPLWIDAQKQLTGQVITPSYREAFRLFQSQKDL